MKKLSTVENQTVLHEEATINEYPVVEQQQHFHLDDVPPKTLNGFNLKKIKSFKIIRKKYKLHNQTTLFIKDLQTVLKEYEPSKFQLDTDILVHICNIAEQYFIYGNHREREEQKIISITTLMKPYFKDDAELLQKMMSVVYDKVNKSTLVKRLYRRFINHFFLK
jgi:hypothetical protein